MALYYCSNTNATTPAQTNMSTTFKTLINLSSQTAASGITLSRAFVYEFEVGTSGLPHSTDSAMVWDIFRSSAVGTGVTGVLNPIDMADAASSHLATINHPTIEPTAVTNGQLWTLAANQRASYRWVVNPGGPGELVVPATAAAGVMLRGKAGTSGTYVSTADAAIYFRE